MHTKPRYVVLFNEDGKEVLFMQELLQQLPIPVEAVCVEKFQHLLEIIDQKPPDAIIVYVNYDTGNSIQYLKNLRVINGVDEILVLVFSTPPEKQMLVNLLQKN